MLSHIINQINQSIRFLISVFTKSTLLTLVTVVFTFTIPFLQLQSLRKQYTKLVNFRFKDSLHQGKLLVLVKYIFSHLLHLLNHQFLFILQVLYAIMIIRFIVVGCVTMCTFYCFSLAFVVLELGLSDIEATVLARLFYKLTLVFQMLIHALLIYFDVATMFLAVDQFVGALK